MTPPRGRRPAPRRRGGAGQPRRRPNRTSGAATSRPEPTEQVTDTVSDADQPPVDDSAPGAQQNAPGAEKNAGAEKKRASRGTGGAGATGTGRKTGRPTVAKAAAGTDAAAAGGRTATVRTATVRSRAAKLAQVLTTPAEPDESPPIPRPIEIGLQVAGTLLAVVLAALVAVIGAFLTPFRVGTTLVPISLVIEVVGIVGVIWFAYQVTRNRLLSLLPALVWLVLSFEAARTTAEGDLVLIGSNWVASAYLLLGPTAIAVCAYRLFLPGRSQEVRRSGRRYQG